MKVKYKDGKSKGQIDVLITIPSDGFVFRVAIECKDYKGPVKAEIVDAFNSKCNRLEGIHKKIIVASNGFQRGAINSAITHEIELFNLEDINFEIVNNWINIRGVRQIKVNKVEIEEYLVFLEDGQVLDNNQISVSHNIFITGEGLLPLHVLLRQTEEQFRANLIRDLCEKLQSEGVLNNESLSLVRKLFMFFMPTLDVPIYIPVNKLNKMAIQRVEMGISYYFNVYEPYYYDLKKYTDFIKEDEKAEVINIGMKESILCLVKNSNTDEMKLFIKDTNGSFEEYIELNK